MKFIFILCLPAVIVFSCGEIKRPSTNDHPSKDSSQNAKVAVQPTKTIEEDTATIKPIFGYRFIITGDFDGDGKNEKIVEHFFSGITGEETAKFYEGLQYDQLVDSTIKKEPVSFVLSDNSKIDTLHISSGGQLLGLSYLKNEGDLNGDGTDEVSYVINRADWSSLNTWHLVTNKNGHWKELYSFPIWDWQLPDLPETFSDDGLFGVENKITYSANDSFVNESQQKLTKFPGLLRKISNNKIKIIYRNEEAFEDSMIVDLNRLDKKK